MKNDLPLIAIDASSGGFKPHEIFFDNADPKSKFEYIIIQHLAPNHKSLLGELLFWHTQIHIQVIEKEIVV